MKTLKMITKGAKMALVTTTLSVAMTSCLGEGDNSYAYIQQSTICYANSNVFNVAFQISSNWKISKGSDADWITLDPFYSYGTGPSMGSVPVKVSPNTTGKVRGASINITGNDGKSHITSVLQYATKGDGSFYNARDVKSIIGSDGSKIELGYDFETRVPVSCKITQNDKVLENIRVANLPAYSDTTRVMRMLVNDIPFTTKVDYGYQPFKSLVSDENKESVDFAINSMYSQIIVKRNEGMDNANVQTFNTSGWLSPDSVSSFTRMIIGYKADGKNMEETLDLKHTEKISNRYQSIDANQLIFGVERMNPFIFLGFYRYARCPFVFESAESVDKKYTYAVSCTLNTDKSINTLTVGREDGTSVTYTFEY